MAIGERVFLHAHARDRVLLFPIAIALHIFNSRWRPHASEGGNMADRARPVPSHAQVFGRTKVVARKRCRPGG